MKQKLHPRSIYLFWINLYFGRRGGGAVFGLVFFYSIVLLMMEALGSEIISDFFEVFGVNGWLIAFMIFILIIVGYIWARLSYNAYYYEISSDALKIEKGVIWKKYISIPYERIQNVDIYRGLAARILKLSDLQIQTAGYGGFIQTEGKLPGLLPEDAERIREDLVKRLGGVKQGL